jgi:hypothetical protein
MILDPTDPSTLTSDALAADEVLLDAAIATAGVAMPLATAQRLKSGFVDGVFNALRQAPIAFTVGASAYTWDARDEAQSALNAALVSALVAGGNAAFVDLFNQLTAILAQVTLAIGNVSGGVSFVDPDALTGPEVMIGSVAWTPIGATATVTLTAAQAGGLIAAVTARRATLQGLRLTKQAAIAACTNNPGVMALAVSSGW